MENKKSLLIVDDDIAHRISYTPKPRIFFGPANLYFEKNPKIINLPGSSVCEMKSKIIR